MSNYKFETLQLHVGQEQADPATDSRAVKTKRGVAAIYEHALNEWTSNYYVEFTDYKNGFKNGEVDKIWSDWYTFEEKASA